MTKMNVDKSIEVIKTDKAGPPVGPYSQGIKAGGFVFVAGEKGMDPITQKMVPGGIEPETRRTLENIKAILEEAGSGMERVVSTFVFTTDLNEFAKRYCNFTNSVWPVSALVSPVV